MQQNMKLFINATVIAVAFFLIFSGSSVARTLNLQRVEEFVLNSNREAALKALISQKTKSNKSEIDKQVFRISRMFFFEKTQKLFERAHSYLSVDLKLAYNDALLALEKEPKNLRLLFLKSRILLMMGQCKSAQILLDGRKGIPEGTDGLFLRASAYVCLKSKNQLGELLKKLTNHKFDEIHMLNIAILKIEHALLRRGREPEKARTLFVETLEKIDEGHKYFDFPPFLYVAWRTGVKGSLLRNRYRDRYITICKKSRAAVIKRFPIRPRVCQRLSILEGDRVKDKMEQDHV